MSNSESLLLNFLSHDSFIQINKRLLQVLKGDVYSAVMLSELVSLYNYYKKRGDLKEGGWFFQTIIDVEENLCISDHIQRRALKYLEEIGFIKTKRMGSQPRRHFWLNFEYMEKALINNETLKKIPKMPNEKKEFYKKLNEAAYSSIPEFYVALHNIKADIGEFMLAWSWLYRKFMAKEWKWDSREYGRISNYWKAVYRNRKPFDYNTLLSYFLSYTTDVSLYDFINFDRNHQTSGSFVSTLEFMIETNPYFSDLKK
jgi:hypothetical protein